MPTLRQAYVIADPAPVSASLTINVPSEPQAGPSWLSSFHPSQFITSAFGARQGCLRQGDIDELF
jgi:hypothetical protein